MPAQLPKAIRKALEDVLNYNYDEVNDFDGNPQHIYTALQAIADYFGIDWGLEKDEELRLLREYAEYR